MGNVFAINTRGIDFVMTALFVVIFLEQWQKKSARIPALIGIVASLFCRVLFGTQWFVLASMGVLILFFSFARKPLEAQRGKES